jgi:hypothetical protein
MDKLQILLASLIVLVICVVIFFNNLINDNPQSDLLKIVGGVSLVASIYFYSCLDKNDVDCIWKIAGGADTPSLDEVPQVY